MPARPTLGKSTHALTSLSTTTTTPPPAVRKTATPTTPLNPHPLVRFNPKSNSFSTAFNVIRHTAGLATAPLSLADRLIQRSPVPSPIRAIVHAVAKAVSNFFSGW